MHVGSGGTEHRAIGVAPGSRSRWKRLVRGSVPLGFKPWPDNRHSKLRVHMASITAVRQAADSSAASSQAHEPSPASCPLDIEGPAAPLLVDSMAPAEEFRVHDVGQEVAAAHLDTDEPGVTSLRATKLPPSIPVQYIVARRGSESYDNIVDQLGAEDGPFEDQIADFIDGLQHEPLARTGLYTKTDSERGYGFYAISCHRSSLQKVQSCGGGSSTLESRAAQGGCLLHPPGVWAGAFLGCLLVGSRWVPQPLTG